MSAFDFRPGDRIITTRADYPSNQLTYLSLARRAGVETVRADDLPEGGGDPASVRQLARHARTRLVALTWVPTTSGVVAAAAGARRFENWEFAYALVAGLGAATRYALAVGSGGRERAHRLAALLRQLLAEIPGVRVLDRGRERCAIVSVGVAGRDAADLKLRLRHRGINASSADRMSGVLDMDDKGATSVLRFSPHYYNTED